MTQISALDLFKVGPGPSSSHTLGPLKAARAFVHRLCIDGLLEDTHAVGVELYGSLGATGPGHGTPGAVLLGLTGAEPEQVTGTDARRLMESTRRSGRLRLMGGREVRLDPDVDLRLVPERTLPRHPNAMAFEAKDASGASVLRSESYSIGGGFVVGADEPQDDPGVEVPHPFSTAAELLRISGQHEMSISEVVMANERAARPQREVALGLHEIWRCMRSCVQAGLSTSGVLPGGLGVERRASGLAARLGGDPTSAGHQDALDWVPVFAMAVNEENAAGNTVVTAPTNGAAGVIPAVLHYCHHFLPGLKPDFVVRFLLTAAAIGTLFKTNASISGAEVGCQGEIGAACSMAAGALAELMGGSPAHVENAAEIALEHNLGLTCDPVGGLVQIPCIERNAIGAIKAIAAARLAMNGTGAHRVPLDTAIEAMRTTGADMSDRYKETARGGLALHVVQC